MFGQLIETSKKWYHEWQQKAREKYLAGYYPGHERMPNFIVRGLYWIGYFIGDFIPLILNLIDGIYWAIKRLIAFIVGLLVESSIFIVLIGSIVFSISHSIERLRIAGATGGLEYVGVLMFEVIFIGSAATLTGILMNKKKLSGPLEWTGMILTLLGFLVGLGFVWWSNYQGMAQTTEGHTIGTLVPALVLIGEGILAYRYLSESEKDDQTKLLEFVQRNGLTVEDLKAIKMYIVTSESGTSETNTSDKVTRDGTSEINTRGSNTRDATSGLNTSLVNTSGSNTSNGTSKQDTSDAFTSHDTSRSSTKNDVTSNPFTSYARTSGNGTSEAGTNKANTSEQNTSNTTNEEGTSEENTSKEITSNNTSELDASTTNTSEEDTSNATSETGTNGSNTSNEVTSKSDTSEENTSNAGTNQKPSNVVELSKHASKRKRTSKRTTWTEEDYQRVRKIALQLREEDPKKELPGRPTLKEKAGCGENLARRVLDDLKEELKQSS